MQRRRVALRELGPAYAFALAVLKPLMLLLTRRDWRGAEKVPATGGVILAANHISHADPIVLADFVVFGAGRLARFLAKSTLFRGRGLVARVMSGAGQIPVHRGTSDAAQALEAAVQALRDGECVVVYPEGTVTRDPDKWPMAAKTGVARLALLSGAPVYPVGQWGAERLLDSYRGNGVHVPARISIAVGEPVDLSAYRGREQTGEVLRAATADVMRAITGLVEELRGERAPADVFDPRAGRPHDEKRTA